MKTGCRRVLEVFSWHELYGPNEQASGTILSILSGKVNEAGLPQVCQRAGFSTGAVGKVLSNQRDRLCVQGADNRELFLADSLG